MLPRIISNTLNLDVLYKNAVKTVKSPRYKNSIKQLGNYSLLELIIFLCVIITDRSFLNMYSLHVHMKSEKMKWKIPRFNLR